MINKFGVTKRAHISRRKFDTIFSCFVEDIPATKTANISGVNRNTANRYYLLIRKLLISSAITERAKVSLFNGIEIDESYFGPTRVRGKRGRGASRKIVVFGMLKRNGRVYTEIVNSAAQKELMPIIRKVVGSGSDIYSDGWKSYDALGVYGYNHKKVKHSEDEFARPDGSHINGVESFWSWTKRRLQKFNGVSKGQFKEYLLESEWRFNHRENLWKDMREMLRISEVI
jgi:transposase-like protein